MRIEYSGNNVVILTIKARLLHMFLGYAGNFCIILDTSPGSATCGLT